MNRRQLAYVLAIVTLATGITVSIFLPLLRASGKPTAELAGRLPDHLATGTLEIDIAVDNTGNTLIDPVCLGITTSPNLNVVSVIFQGVDDVAVHDGYACGGKLAAQQTVSARLRGTATNTGTATVTLIPAQAQHQVGQSLGGTVVIG